MKNSTHLNKSINLSIEEINNAVAQLSTELKIAGSFSKDESEVNLYQLLQNYLLDLEIREKINSLLNLSSPTILALTDKEFEDWQVKFELKNGINSVLENNILHYLRLKSRHLKLNDWVVTELKNEIINHLASSASQKELMVKRFTKKKLLISIDEVSVEINVSQLNEIMKVKKKDLFLRQEEVLSFITDRIGGKIGLPKFETLFNMLINLIKKESDDYEIGLKIDVHNPNQAHMFILNAEGNVKHSTEISIKK